MLGGCRANRFAVERSRQRLAKCHETLHLDDALGGEARFRGGGRCRRAHLVTLAELVEDEGGRQDDKPGQQLKAAALVEVVRVIQGDAERSREDRKDRDGDHDKPVQIVAPDQPHWSQPTGHPRWCQGDQSANIGKMTRDSA